EPAMRLRRVHTWYRAGGGLARRTLVPKGALAAPAGEEAAPAAGLCCRRGDLFREFIVRCVLVDPWIIGRPDDRDHRWDRRGVRLAKIGAGAEQGCCRDLRRFGRRG